MSNNIFKLSLLNKDNKSIKTYSFGNKNPNNEYNDLFHEIIIHNDDSLENIKYKLTSVLEDKNMEHYYFFYKTYYNENDYINLFNKISKNKTTITQRKLDIILKNLNINIILDKDEYNINDFIEIFKDVDEKLELNIVFDMKSSEFNFITNPLLNIFNYDDTRSYKNGDLLFENQMIIDNIVYCIHISEFLDYASNNTDKFNLDNTLGVYYPKLYEKKLFTMSEINSKSITDNNLYQEKYDIYNNLINAHYNFHNNEIGDEIKKEHYFGIKSIDFAFYNKNDF